MQKLNLPETNFKILQENNKLKIFDIIRKKYVAFTPEEHVRQQFIHFLIKEKKYPKGLLAVEKQLKIYDLEKRTDILLYNTSGKPDVIIECKAPKINITQKTFDQIARYNLALNASYLMVTNGINHYYCTMDFEAERYQFLKDIPNYNSL